MRLIYFVVIDDEANIGVNTKIISQCRSLISIGFDVELLVVGNRLAQFSDLEFIRYIKCDIIDTISKIGYIARILRQYKIGIILRDIIISSNSSDIVYLRYPYPIFYIPWPYIRNRRKCKLINEHNTIEARERKLVGDYLLLFIEYFIGNIIRNQSDGIVGVTEEITEYQVKKSGDPNKPHITIGNGIDLNKVKLRTPAGYNGEELLLLAVANISRWHGIDRLIRALAVYRGITRIILHLVGEGKEIENLKKLSYEYNVADNVIFHGFLSGVALDKLFDKCHIAVGSLGIHRKGLKMTSELKIREYTARGMPFIYSGFDADFNKEFPYCLDLPAGESVIRLEQIIEFTEKVYRDNIHHIKMRNYAFEFLDWRIKMKLMEKFCESISNQR